MSPFPTSTCPGFHICGGRGFYYVCESGQISGHLSHDRGTTRVVLCTHTNLIAQCTIRGCDMVLRGDDGLVFWGASATPQSARVGPRRVSRRAHATMDVPTSYALRPNELYDQVLAFACDVLGIQSLDLRSTHSDDCEAL
jgi:hypothetical protein